MEGMERVKFLAAKYWRIRNSGDLSEARSMAHNDLLDAMDAAGIVYEDREDAAKIGREIVAGTFMFETGEIRATPRS
jgi:hypothetical protein